jgi:hypothetical protein
MVNRSLSAAQPDGDGSAGKHIVALFLFWFYCEINQSINHTAQVPLGRDAEEESCSEDWLYSTRRSLACCNISSSTPPDIITYAMNQ